MPASTGTGGLAYLNAETAAALAGPASLSGEAGGEAPIVVTRYQVALALLKDHRWRREAAAIHSPIGPASVMSVTNMDPPRHTVIRRMLGPMFSRPAVSRLRDLAQDRAHRLCDQILLAGPPADLVSQFCGPFAYSLHCDLLGIPGHARDAVLHASLRRSGQPDATAQENFDAEMMLHGEVTSVLVYLQRHGGWGIYPELIALHRAGLLDAEDLGGLASSLLFDGHILASSQIANAVAAMLCFPAVRTSSAGPGGLSPAAREELLRWSPAITLGMSRRAVAEVRLGGATVQEGQAAVVAFAMANRDPAVFDHPAILDPDRPPGRHLAFGYGAHYCLGAHLARLELDVAVSVLLSRLQGLRLANSERDLAWSATQAIRSLGALPVTWDHGISPRPAAFPVALAPFGRQAPSCGTGPW